MFKESLINQTSQGYESVRGVQDKLAAKSGLKVNKKQAMKKLNKRRIVDDDMRMGSRLGTTYALRDARMQDSLSHFSSIQYQDVLEQNWQNRQSFYSMWNQKKAAFNMFHKDLNIPSYLVFSSLYDRYKVGMNPRFPVVDDDQNIKQQESVEELYDFNKQNNVSIQSQENQFNYSNVIDELQRFLIADDLADNVRENDQISEEVKEDEDQQREYYSAFEF